MNRQMARVMLLIDADNVSADVIEQAIDLVTGVHGAIHVRRAYCTAEAAVTHQKLFKTHSIRPIVNLSTGKNSNDIALAIDAMDLAVAERPDVAVIVSSDSDFAPLVIRLREKGCRVEGIGQQGKTGDDAKPVYDSFADLPHRKGGAAGAAAPKTAAKRGSSTARSRRSTVAPRGDAAEPVAAPTPSAAQPPGPISTPAPAPALLPSSSRSRSRSRSASRSDTGAERGVPAEAPTGPSKRAAALARAPATSAPASGAASAPLEVQRILAELPELLDGDMLALGVAAERLRSANLLTRRGSPTDLFGKYPELFALTPARQPNKVMYIGPQKKV